MLLKNIALAAFAIALTGCASQSDVDALSAKVDNLSSQISQLTSTVDEVKANQADGAKVLVETLAVAEVAAVEAARANERIDNLVSSYKK